MHNTSSSSSVMAVAVLGLGHVGAPLAVAMASSPSLRVVGIDHNPDRLDALREARGVEDALKPHLRARHDEGSLDFAPQLSGLFDAIVIAIEPSGVEPLAELVGHAITHLESGGVLVIASTCQPAWFTHLVEACEQRGIVPGEQIHLAHAPERMMPGKALDEVVSLPRVVGGYTPACVRAAMRCYESFVRGDVRSASLEEAALIKIAENAYRAINVVLANQIADVASQHGLSAMQVIAAANTHPRVALHAPGAGAWGRCLPLAMELLASEGSELARVASDLNKARPIELADALAHRLEGIDTPVVVVCGVAYKRDLSDDRNSAGRQIVTELERLGCEVRSVDPHVEGTWSLDAALRGAHALIYTVAHAEFLAHPHDEVRASLAPPAIMVDVTGQISM